MSAWKRWRLPNMTLRQALLGQFLLVMAGASVVAALLLVLWRLPLIQQQNEMEQIRAARIATFQVEVNLQNAEKITLALAQALDYARSASFPNRYAMDHFLLEGAKKSELFEALYVLDGQARIIDLVAATAGPDMAAQWQSSDMSGLAALQYVKKYGQPIWSDQYRSPVLDRPVMAFVTPMQGGYLIVELSLERLAQVVHESAVLEGIMVIITDRKGEVVAAPDMSWAAVRRNISTWPAVRAAIQGQTLHATMQIDGRTYMGTAQRLERTGWVVLAGYPEEQMLASARAAVLISFTGIAIVIAFCMLLFWKSTSVIKRRLDRSLAFTAAVAQGQYETPMDESGLTELDTLSRGMQQMAHTVRNREAQLRAITQFTPTVAIQWFDRDARVLDWNPASEALLGWSREEAIGKTLDELIYTPEDHAWCLEVLRDMERTGAYHGPHEGMVLKRLQEPVWLLSTTFPIAAQDGSITFVSMNVDITHKHELENQLRQINAELEERVALRTKNLSEAIDHLEKTRTQLVQSEKLASLGSLVAGVAHELNTPIGNSLMSASTLEHKLKAFRSRLDAGLRKAELEAFVSQVGTGIDITARNLQRAAELVSSFKQVAVDQTSAQRRPFSLNEVLHEIVLTLEPSLKHANVHVSVQIDQDVQMDSYPGPLGQVLTNLIQNAVIHAFPGLTRDQIPGQVEILTHVQGAGAVEIAVCDNGVGIAREHIDKIFDPFFTSRLGQGGSGLGLHISHNIVTAMLGGTLSAANRPSGGAKFTIVCPLQAPKK